MGGAGLVDGSNFLMIRRLSSLCMLWRWYQQLLKSLFSNAEYDEEDKEADVVYDKIDVKMDQRRLKQREKKMREQIKELRAAKPTIQQQFADLKRELATVSNEEWEGIPEAQEHLKVKQRKSSNFTPTPDALLAGMASGRGVSGSATPMGGSATPMGGNGAMQLQMGSGYWGSSVLRNTHGHENAHGRPAAPQDPPGFGCASLIQKEKS
ncbi:STA1 [Symbiodinium natans]|uniref:STA1 protein n=1 Tax=Symbiodinium natans TaxID=878477 RepID=A0A812R5W3_9DINO|nr:STA1 [Symbiodinium natans]